MTETLASTILTASITGAGLILAIYALITPIARGIFEDRVKLLRKKRKQFDEMKAKISSESSDKEFKQFKTLSTEIKGMKIFPRYLGFGVLAVFSLYIITAFSAVGWLMNPSLDDFSRDFTLVMFFFVSTFGFLFVGSYAITDVLRTMIREFEQIKKEKEEVEKASRAFEEKGLVIRGLVRKKKEKDGQEQG